MEAMERLIAAVEAGKATYGMFTDALSSPCQDMGSTQMPYDAQNAYRGSLDAAKALHDALLPGWVWGRTEGNIYVTNPERGSRSTKWGGPNEVAARSWLLAILKARRARPSA